MIQATNISKIFHHSEQEVKVFSHLNFHANKAESVAIVGASGRGKTTLLYLLSGLDSTSFGEILVEGKSLQKLHEEELAQFRAENFGFVFQHHFLLNDLSAWDNCLLPLRILNKNISDFIPKLEELFNLLQVAHRKNHLPDELSGGEKQRIALIRALIHQPKIIFADEPTGALDKNNAKILEELLIQLCREKEITLIMSTHNIQLAQACDRIFDMN